MTDMPIPRDDVEELRPLAFRQPEAVLETDRLNTEIDPDTESMLLDWTIPWMLDNADSFVFAEPESEAEPGYYGLASESTPDR